MTAPIALVTGVGRSNSIGHAIVLALAADGWDVAFTSWRAYEQRVPLGGDPANDPDRLVAAVQASGRRAVAFEADLSDPTVPDRLLADVGDALGSVGALVLSHAESVDSGILDTTPESFDRHFAVNTRAAWLLIRAFAGQVPPGGGRIVALTSDHIVGNVPYGASKGALDRIVIAAARELAPLGITANLVNPGPVDTGWMDEDTRAALAAHQPTGRLGTPDDAARLVRFLVSDDAHWVTGQLIKSDGGFSI
ncbi:SDR family oxidoreductase [Agromyces larvae]|uniref:SDR family oxidoreductase n=1 Tax=Agromyces larvae TaxID=2929802 RepID=A0ABY4C0U2_9MICO|nr:SDR family oxidoreductase [Agromyces larvae]UOE45102.1 SDR family oxidoreductase [Agromyces larvae]